MVTLSGGGYLDNEAGATIAATGTAVYGTGGSATVVNAGTIEGTSGALANGIQLGDGGSVTNGGTGATAALVSGVNYGIRISGAFGTVINDGTIAGTSDIGIRLDEGGRVTNGGASATAALISGAFAGILVVQGTTGTGTVTNYATISGGRGVYLQTGGSVTNGSTAATAALLSGYFFGVVILGEGPNTVTNYGTIEATQLSNDAAGVVVGDGSVTNGGIGEQAALISGYDGIDISGGAVTNYGTIEGTSAHVYGTGVVSYGGSITNGGTGAQAALISGYDAGIIVKGAAGTVANDGTVQGTGRALGAGVYLKAGGSVTNGETGATAALISGYNGIFVVNAVGTVVNDGTVTGLGVPNRFGWFAIDGGVYLKAGGSVANGAPGATGARIAGYSGIVIKGAAGTVTNDGTITGADSHFEPQRGRHGDGVYLTAGGSVTNGGTGATAALISGYGGGVSVSGAAGTVTNYGTIAGSGTGSFSSGVGVALAAGGTVTDSGTISGGDGTAIYFGGAGDNLLALEQGYSLAGAVIVAGTANTLELLGTAGAVTVAFDKVGAGFTNFGTAAFGAASGNDEMLEITDTSATLPGTISSFTALQDIVDLTGVAGGTIVGGGTVNGSDQLVVSNGTQTVTLQLDTGESYSGITWQTSPDRGIGTDITPACFCRGTLILTDCGEVPVEELAIGDKVVTFSGTVRPIRWIGQRAYDGRFVTGNRAMLPIRVAAGALADRVPARDLFVSPEHALYLEGLFLPARLLVNGATIRQAESVERLEYFHIELDAHDIIFAEGAAAETFIAVAGRAIFHNGAEFAALYPDAGPADWEPYAVLLAEGEAALPVVRAALLERAENLGRVSRDPDLHLIVDGAVVRAQSADGGTHHFAVPAGARSVAIASLRAAPAESEAASLDDRRLGVPFERVVLCGAGTRIELGPGCLALCDGFHRDEGSHRWTDGRAFLPAGLLDGFADAFTVEVPIGATDLHYPLAAASLLPHGLHLPTRSVATA